MNEHSLRYFRYQHLPDYLQDVSRPFCDLADSLVRAVSVGMADSRETAVALRKLLEAKDAAVRAAL